MPAPRVAVITPYVKEEDAWLEQNHASVRAQTYPCEQIFVSDGHPNPLIDGFEAQHIRLGVAHSDWGDTPRALGSLSAVSQGFDAIAYLDADNWYAPNHIENLVRTHEKTGAQICTSGRIFHSIDGTPLVIDLTSDGEQFTDTSALMLFKGAFKHLSAWALMAPEFHAIGDRMMWHVLKTSGLPRAHCSQPTLAYRHVYTGMYQALGLPIPPNARTPSGEIAVALDKWRAAGLPPIDPRWRVMPIPKPEPLNAGPGKQANT